MKSDDSEDDKPAKTGRDLFNKKVHKKEFYGSEDEDEYDSEEDEDSEDSEDRHEANAFNNNNAFG